MTVHVYEAQVAPRALPRYALVGQRHESGVVHHVALLGVAVDSYRAGMPLKVIEVAPPVRLGSPDWTHRVADLVAWIDLTDDEREAIDLWLRELFLRRNLLRALGVDAPDRWNDFVLYPCRLPTTNPVRFSCAGLAWSAYADSDADIEFVDLDTLPLIRLDELVATWRFLDDPALRSRRADFGLDAGDAWPVLLPGYLFHAVRTFRRDAPSYRPAVRDSAWPPFADP